MKNWLLVVTFTFSVGALAFDHNSLSDNETLYIKLTQLKSGRYVDGIGKNEFRLVPKLRILHSQKGPYRSWMAEYKLGKSQLIKMYSNEEFAEDIPAVVVPAKKINDIFKYLRKHYGADRYDLILEIEEVDPIFNDSAAETTLYWDGTFREARTDEGTEISLQDFADPLYSYDGEVLVEGGSKLDATFDLKIR